jgi:hypothetical protein
MWRASLRRLEAVMSVMEGPFCSISAPVSLMLTPAIADLSPAIKKIADTNYLGNSRKTASHDRRNREWPNAAAAPPIRNESIRLTWSSSFRPSEPSEREPESSEF